ncbi:MAG: hypothetical protein FWD08_01310 [Alphaproteobacteria bacterium]|nr:hypothetical protein [Alphaproteobacteria bacterium]
MAQDCSTEKSGTLPEIGSACATPAAIPRKMKKPILFIYAITKNIARWKLDGDFGLVDP